MRHMDFEQVEAGIDGKVRGSHEVSAHVVHVEAGHLARDLRPIGEIRQRRGRNEGPIAGFERFAVAFPQFFRRAFAAAP